MSEGAELYSKTTEQYRKFINPSLARVMKLSGSVVEVTAQGTIICDHQGKTYLDFAGGYGVFTLGHRHPRVSAAVHAQLDLMALSGKTMFNPVMGRLAERLASLAPGALEISFFTNSGTESVEAALKLARAATKRSMILATTDAYHGKTLGALSVSGRETFRTPFEPLLSGVLHMPYDDLAAAKEAFAAHGPDIAALIVEPIQGEGGVIVPHDGYLAGLRELCDSEGTLLIFDEVQSGLGRCGTLFACDHEGVVPDLMTLAKGLSGGVMPIGAMIATPMAWNAAYRNAPLLHTSTFGGNPLACAAALEALAVLQEDNLAERARVLGAAFLSKLLKLATDFPEIIREVRGRGLLLGIELTHEGYGGTIIPEMLKRGITVAWTLNQQRVIRLEPPLIVSEEEIQQCIRALHEAFGVALERLGILSGKS
jgi:putrescine aminotransferase